MFTHMVCRCLEDILYLQRLLLPTVKTSVYLQVYLFVKLH